MPRDTQARKTPYVADTENVADAEAESLDLDDRRDAQQAITHNGCTRTPPAMSSDDYSFR